MSTIYHAAIPVDLAAPSRQRIGAAQFFMGDNDSHVFTALVADTAEPEAGLRAGTVSGTALRADGVTVALEGTKGAEVQEVTFPNGITAQATPCSVTLPQAAFAVPGSLLISIKLTEGATATTVLAMTGTVVRTETDTAVDPGEVIPDLAELQAAAAEALEAADDATDAAADARAAASSAVRYDTAQSLTVAQKAQARGNINAQERIEPDGAVTLDLSDSAAAYISGNVGQTISYKTATTSKVYKRIAWVQAGCEYVLTATSGSLSGTTSRTCAITNASDIIRQKFDWTMVANGTAVTTFTANVDGLLCITVDTGTTTVALHGGPVYGTVRYNTTQSLTDAQQAQALVNVGAASQNAIAPSDTTTAATQHTAGSLLTVGGTLYKATQTILVGDTINSTNVTETTVAAQLAERDTAIAAETAARETAIAGLPMSAGAYFSGLLGANGTVTVNAKELTIVGNHVQMHGLGTGTNASTFAMFNVLGTAGGVSGQYSEARVKSLFTSGYCYTADGSILPPNRTGILRVASVKRSAVTPQNAWEFGIGLYTYNATTDTLTAGYHGYTYSDYMNGSANCPLAFEVSLSAEFIEAVRTNKTLALVIYGKSGAQYASSSLDLYWEIIPVALTT